MSVPVEIRFSGGAAASRRCRSAPARSRTSRGAIGQAAAPRSTQRSDRRRPNGVRGPGLVPAQRVRLRRALTAPPVPLETGVRLTDRGLAAAMVLAAVLVIAAVLCITTTALRVTAEPAGPGSAVVASDMH